MSDERPIRNDSVEVDEVSDGFVVYDGSRDRVHYLNQTAALVLEFCTGENTPVDIATILKDAYRLPELPEAETNA